jgi:uncharacterized protein (DUF885 family)
MTNRGPADFDAFMETIYVDMMREVPELSMLMGIAQVGGAACPLDRFAVVSDEAVADRLRLLESIEHRLAAFARACLSPSQRITAQVLEYFLSFGVEGPWIGLRGAEFARHSYLVNPGHGEPSRLLGALTQHHPLRNLQDAEDYLIRSEALGEAIAHIERQVALRERRGILLPSPLLRQSIEELRGMLALAPDANPIYAAFAAKSAGIAALSAGRRQAMLEALSVTLKKRVLPAYVALAERMEALVPVSSPDPGLWRLPDGDAYYQFLLRAATTTELTASQVHDLGIEHVSRLRARIPAALNAAGLASGDIIGSLRELESQTRFPPSIERAALLARCESILTQVRARLPELFDRLPSAEIVTEPVPVFSEDVRHTTYEPGAADGSRPARMLINLRDVAADSELDLPTLLYHELYPGHHLQLSYAQQISEIPTFRRAVTFDAYLEGWAKYAETIPWEHEINMDPRWHAMRLRRELLSTANLVLDTGIHHRRWTLEKAADYLSDTTGCSAAMGRSIALRSASLPAQLCSYKIGMLQFMELKQRFERVRGAAFDIREFHTAVLEHGAVPLGVLKSVVESAIDAPGVRGPS